ncbi:MAG TPA: S8 family serine peptidase [Mycobacteriales bacterium]
MSAVAGPGRPPLTWNLLGRGRDEIRVRADGYARVSREWAVGGATGAGVRVCLLDSGIEPNHPRIGPVQGWYGTVAGPDGEPEVRKVDPGDASGHGTACASVIRSIAPECDLHSVRVIESFAGTGEALLAGLRWAVEGDFDVINISLSTTRRRYVAPLRELLDQAYFTGKLVVAAAHNLAVESYPWRFSSVLSVGTHGERRPDLILYNPNPPVEFFAHGLDVEVGWLGGSTVRVTGNSFAAPHLTGYCALIRSKHPQLTNFQVRNTLYLMSDNVEDRS